MRSSPEGTTAIAWIGLAYDGSGHPHFHSRIHLIDVPRISRKDAQDVQLICGNYVPQIDDVYRLMVGDEALRADGVECQYCWRMGQRREDDA